MVRMAGLIVRKDIDLVRERTDLKAVVEAAGGHLGQVVRLGLFLTDLKQFATVNSIMAEYFHAPYPARSTVQVAALPKGAPFEVEATLVLA